MPEAAMQKTRDTCPVLIVAAATLMSFLLYLDRFCVSFAVDYIRQDLGMSQGQVKWFLSAFFWSYALAQVPAGWLSDRYGARIMLVVYILTWSFFTGLIGAANSFCHVDCVAARSGIRSGRGLSDSSIDCWTLDAGYGSRKRERDRLPTAAALAVLLLRCSLLI